VSYNIKIIAGARRRHIVLSPSPWIRYWRCQCVL